ncbi:hypothetical protein PVAP13_7KG237900 [Panicum virgatum]|uniref:Uncharacterized protein n=1 Tax=Panicum virgatum TaxID=38727 RepID=A0A8T0QE53_PANVG|nr:hypothetical protein PVAP13_7KG237900 [Panicum virgatum]
MHSRPRVWAAIGSELKSMCAGGWQRKTISHGAKDNTHIVQENYLTRCQRQHAYCNKMHVVFVSLQLVHNFFLLIMGRVMRHV